MSLETKVMDAMKDAMRSKDEGALRGIRAIKAAIILAKTEKGSTGEVNEEQEMKLLQKLVKQRKEAMEIFQKENRNDLAKKEADEIAVIEKFLPQQMSQDELRSELKKIIETTGAKTPQDMGKIMGVASKQFAGRADGKAISEIVRELLANH
jgi:uncharacterized protein